MVRRTKTKLNEMARNGTDGDWGSTVNITWARRIHHGLCSLARCTICPVRFDGDRKKDINSCANVFWLTDISINFLSVQLIRRVRLTVRGNDVAKISSKTL